MTAPTETPKSPEPPANLEHLAPGVTITARDEDWLVTHVSRTKDGFKIKARGLTPYVQNTTATFYTALERDLAIFDPTQVSVVADHSPGLRRTRLWLESMIRSTPLPLHSENLDVSERMLLDSLSYQRRAVERALSPELKKPRILLADAVGLGKTLEIGMIMAELIRRGRGERILVVTPKQVLEQFQQEMWVRFSIPLVRLDSLGIQKVRRKLPASKNPFSYFPQVIVSIDTLKSPKYRAQLEKVHWDIVVVDEAHNASNRGTQNNALLRTIAPRTEALILASATPHNGDPKAFVGLLQLLDEDVVTESGDLNEGLIQKLLIRRHRNSKEVKTEVGENWAERAEPKNIQVEPSDEELAVVRELRESWIRPEATQNRSRGAGSGDHLFAWTLVKAFLSSPVALLESIDNRLRSLDDAKGDGAQEARQKLLRLKSLVEAIDKHDTSKYRALVDYLHKIGVGKNSTQRVVIFSERVRTVEWLQEQLQEDLQLKEGAVKFMHGGEDDPTLLSIIDEFKRKDTPLRVLVTGDVSSEGVNLHDQCHDLVHYDTPWSLIRIQQRNGRIDRYGQRHNPRIAALLLNPGEVEGFGDLTVFTKLIQREHEANKILGDAAQLMGKYSEKAEEDTIRDVLRGKISLEAALRGQSSAQDDLSDDDFLKQLTSRSKGASGKHMAVEKSVAEDDSVTSVSIEDLLALASKFEQHNAGKPQAPVSEYSLYDSEQDYLSDALQQAFGNAPHKSLEAGGVGLEYEDGYQSGLIRFTPPADLVRRLDFLPQDYVEYRNVKTQLKLVTLKELGKKQVKRAKEGRSEKTWPEYHFLGPLHPVTTWAVDRALASLPRAEVPAVYGTVEDPTAIFLQTRSDSRGRTLSRHFKKVVLDVPQSVALDRTTLTVEDLPDAIGWLRSIGLTKDANGDSRLEISATAREVVSAGLQEIEDQTDAFVDERTLTRPLVVIIPRPSD